MPLSLLFALGCAAPAALAPPPAEPPAQAAAPSAPPPQTSLPTPPPVAAPAPLADLPEVFPAAPPDPGDAFRSAALRDAAQFGLIGIIRALPPPSPYWSRPIPALELPNVLTGRWGEVDSTAVLALTGTGSGSNARGATLDLGSLYVPSPRIDHVMPGRTGGPPIGNVQCIADGPDGCRLRIAGALPAEVIQRVVRRNFGHLSACYAAGLHRDAALSGSLYVHFTIGADGAVVQVRAGTSDLADPEVVTCVLRSFYGLAFPAPEGGVVTVVYPVSFSPLP